MWRVLTARLTRGATSKDLIFCVDAGFCFIRKMAVALAGPVRSWSPPLLSRRRSLTSKPHVVLVPPSSPARGFSPNFHERRGYEKLHRPGLTFCQRQGGRRRCFRQ